MDLETFKSIYGCRPVKDKIRALIMQCGVRQDNAVEAERARANGNSTDEEYWRQEALLINERIRWLYSEITGALEEKQKEDPATKPEEDLPQPKRRGRPRRKKCAKTVINQEETQHDTAE